MRNINPFDKTDKKIAESITKQVQTIEASDALRNRVMAEIHGKNKEAVHMKKTMSIRKIVVAAAAFTILGSVAVFAASGLFGGTYAFSSHRDDVKNYAKAATMAEELGYDTMVTVPESLGDFQFKVANIGESGALGEDGKPAGEAAKDLNVSYRNEEQDKLSLNVSKAFTGEEAVPNGDAEKTVNGFTLRYNADNYLFVGEESDVTEADREAEAEGNLYISYGGSGMERTETAYESVSWIVDGVNYLLMIEDADLGEEAMFDLAEEWMNAK